MRHKFIRYKKMFPTLRKTRKGLKRSMLGIFLHEYNQSKMIRERSKGRDHGIVKTEVPLGLTNHKVFRKLVEPCSCRVISERVDITTSISSMTMGGENCQAIQDHT